MFRFPWGDMHSLNLGWFLQKFNELREDWATAEAGIDGALDAEIQKAEDALSDVFDARDAAAASATAAAGSATSAGTSATAAQNSATAAASSATLANQKATAAGLSEAAAAQSATQAAASETAAARSATQASQNATNAAASETAAGQQATNAAGSAASAAQEATAAAGSATAAAASAATAENVLNSIPSDYSALQAQVNTIETKTENPYPQSQSERIFGGIYENDVTTTGKVHVKRINNYLNIQNLISGGNVTSNLYIGRTKASQFLNSTILTETDLTDLAAYSITRYDLSQSIIMTLSTKILGHALRKLGVLLYNSSDFTMDKIIATAGNNYSAQNYSYLVIPPAKLALYDRMVPFIQVANTAPVNSLGDVVLEIKWNV